MTGASGFVGRILCAYLKERGWDVVGSGDLHQDGLIHCDVTDPGQVRALIATAGKCTHVFHLAALTFVPQANERPGDAINANLMGTIHLTEALRTHGAQARLIYIGSADAYGPPQSLPIDENHPLNPQNPYAISKAAADHYCAFLSKSSGLEIIRMRPFNHSGPGQSDHFVLSSFARQIAAIECGQAPPVLRVGNLEAARDFLHVQDVVRAYELAALKGHPGEAYNVCSGKAHRIQDVLDAMLEMATVKIEVEPDPARLRPVDVPRVEGAYLKLESHTGWLPNITFDTLLRDLLIDWRARLAGASGEPE
ncbi:MAG: GDP-mannose 4,6-dehydratase [Candidatus Hydrogenedentes bacterium]|nr:GDP-mannose 4,6-dehydratase [Candidatus Hydrogenedentota bacterium]MBI3118718.1 GDP-mannose 4,6-dehydratase [Candidatus Hydrogenedentota bacterium]